jgi:hypothetical protein
MCYFRIDPTLAPPNYMLQKYQLKKTKFTTFSSPNKEVLKEAKIDVEQNQDFCQNIDFPLF